MYIELFTVMCNSCIINDLHQSLVYMTMCVCACAHMCMHVCVLSTTCGTAKQMLRFLFQNSLDIQVHMQAYACEYVCVVCVCALAQNVREGH